MTSATATSKGQITIPKDVRDILGIEAGTVVDFVRVGPREYRLRPKNLTVDDLFGMVKYNGPPISLEDMDDAIAAGAAESAP